MVESERFELQLHAASSSRLVNPHMTAARAQQIHSNINEAYSAWPETKQFLRETLQWQLSESVEYLRQLGALDDADPSNLRVIIPSYLSGASNCIASSTFYSVYRLR